MTGEVIRNAKLRILEVFQVEINMFLLGLYAPFMTVFGRGHDGVPLAPHAEVSDIDECDMRIVVVTLGHRLQKVIDLFEEDGIFVFRLLVVAFDIVALRSGIKYPLGSRMIEPALHGADTEGDEFSLIDPSLCRCIEQLPHEYTLFRFEKGPRDPQVDGAQARKVIECVPTERVATRNCSGYSSRNAWSSPYRD